MRGVVAAVGIAVVFAAGCGGSGERQEGGSAARATPAADAARQLAPAAFARTVRRADVVTVNVHVPYEGEIAGTDRFVDYRDAATARLPRGKTIALYCRSGNMSRIAARTLRGRGYTKLVELSGGMDAWRASGRALLDRG